MDRDINTKADPLGGIIPQELVSGDVLRGYGPRRGNLERLLRYWRPIMKKPGGFRRCRVILANHPELYPLERICAWLHHETTGLWPNEGCHHPGMKNCRGKLKKRNWSNREFSRNLRSLGSGKKDALEGVTDTFFHDFVPSGENSPLPVVTNSDFDHGMNVLSEFMEMEPGFVKFLRDSENWEIEGEDVDGLVKSLPMSDEYMNKECCGNDE